MDDPPTPKVLSKCAIRDNKFSLTTGGERDNDNALETPDVPKDAKKVSRGSKGGAN